VVNSLLDIEVQCTASNPCYGKMKYNYENMLKEGDSSRSTRKGRINGEKKQIYVNMYRKAGGKRKKHGNFVEEPTR
jgi:hypothetical protein